MPKIPACRVVTLAAALLVGAVAASQTAHPPASSPPAGPVTLDSPLLSVEVAMHPCRYRLVERATGRVLVEHLAKALRIGDTVPETRDLASATKAEDGLEAMLARRDRCSSSPSRTSPPPCRSRT